MILVSPVKVEEPRRVPGTGTDEMLIYDTIKAKAVSTGTILEAWSEDRENLK